MKKRSYTVGITEKIYAAVAADANVTYYDLYKIAHGTPPQGPDDLNGIYTAVSKLRKSGRVAGNPAAGWEILDLGEPPVTPKAPSEKGDVPLKKLLNDIQLAAANLIEQAENLYDLVEDAHTTLGEMDVDTAIAEDLRKLVARYDGGAK